MTDPPDTEPSSLFEAKEFGEPSVFTPDALLENARRQKNLPDRSVPDICVLDPDGDIVRQLRDSGDARKDDTWPGYHTEFYRFERDGEGYSMREMLLAVAVSAFLSGFFTSYFPGE